MKTVESIQSDMFLEIWKKDNFVASISFATKRQCYTFLKFMGPYLSWAGIDCKYDIVSNLQFDNSTIRFFSDCKVSREKIYFAISTVNCLRQTES